MTPFEVIKQKYKPLFAWEDFMQPETKFAGYRSVLVVTIDSVSVMMLPGRYTKKDFEKLRRNVMGDIITWIEVMAKRPNVVEIDFAAPDSMERFDEAMKTFAFMANVRPAGSMVKTNAPPEFVYLELGDPDVFKKAIETMT